MLILEQDAVYNIIISINIVIYIYKQFTSLSCSIPLDEHEMPRKNVDLA